MSGKKRDHTAPLERIPDTEENVAHKVRHEFPGLGDVHARPNLWNVRWHAPLMRHEVAVLTQLHRSGGSADFKPSENSRLVYQTLVHEKDGTWLLSNRGAMCLAQRGIIPTG